MNLRHLAALLKRYPKLRTLTLAQMSAYRRIWQAVLTLEKEA